MKISLSMQNLRFAMFTVLFLVGKCGLCQVDTAEDSTYISDSLKQYIAELQTVSVDSAIKEVKKICHRELQLGNWRKAAQLSDFQLDQMTFESHGSKWLQMVAYKSYILDNNQRFIAAKNGLEEALRLVEGDSTNIRFKRYAHKILGKTYTRFGDFKRAEIHLLSAIDPDATGYTKGKLLNDLGVLYISLGETEKAYQHLSDALTSVSENHPFRAVVQLNLSQALMQMGMHEQANSHLSECILAFDDQNGYLGLANAYVTKAELLAEKDSLSHAIENNEIALTGFRSNNLTQTRDYIKALNQHGDLHYKLGQLEEAKNIFADVLNSLGELTSKTQGVNRKDPLQFDALHGFSKTNLEIGLRKNDTISFLQAINQVDSIITLAWSINEPLQFDESTFFLSKQLHRYVEIGLSAVHELYSRTKSEKHLSKAIWYMEQVKASTLAQELAQARLMQETHALDSLSQEYKNLQYQISELSQRTEQTEVVQQELYDLLIKKGELQRLLKSHSKLIGSKKEKPVDTYIQQYQDKTVVHYFLGEQTLYAIVLKKEESDFIDLQIKPNQLRADIDSLLTHLYVASDEYFPKANAFQKQIWEPLSLDNTDSDVLLIPDGVLAQIPFEALVKDYSPSTKIRNKSYLITAHNIIYAFSLDIEMQLSKVAEHKTAKENMAFYAPIFENSPEFARLGFSVEMMDWLKESFRTHVFTREEATKSHLIDHLQQYNIIHIDSHGGQDATSGQNWISLTDTHEDHVLTLGDIYLNPTSANLIYINACEAGIGQLLEGEGMMSFTRSFQSAGCPTVIASLWKVNNQSAIQLTKKFYNGIYSGENIANALRNAKLNYIKTEDIPDAMAHPFYWAAAGLYGHNNHLILDEHATTVYMSWILGLLLLGVFFLLFKNWKKR